MTDIKLPKLWTETELASYLGVSNITVTRERQRGRLGYTRIGTKIRFTDEQIAAYLKSRATIGDAAKLAAKLKAVK